MGQINEKVEDDGLDYNKQTFHGADEYSPLSGFLCEAYGLKISAVFGKIWSLSRNEGYSYASVGTMAKELGVDPHTVAKAIKTLIDLKLIIDVTEKKKESHIAKYGKAKKKLPYHKQVRFYTPDARVLAKLKTAYNKKTV